MPLVLLVVDERIDRRDALVHQLRAAGFATTTEFGSEAVAAVVAAVEPDDSSCLPACARVGPAESVPVIALVDEPAPELCLRAVIEGAVRCIARDDGAAAIVAVLTMVLAADAPPLAQLQRRARIGALEALARSGHQSTGDDDRHRVRLTRLERGPVRVLPPAPSERATRLADCTPKQRELLDTITRTGSVTRAAGALGTSRSNMYAALRRIAHRLQLRDSGELLRLIGAEDPAGRL